MNYLLFFTALLTAVTNAYYWHQSRVDQESVRIYKTIVAVAVVVASISGISLIPRAILELCYRQILFVLTGIITLCIVIALLQIILKATYPRKVKLWGSAALSLTLILCMVIFYKHFSTTDSLSAALEEVNNRAAIARNYAEKQLMQKTGISPDQIKSCLYSFDREEPVYYKVVFTYGKEGEESEKVYGYQISVNDSYYCTITKQGEGIGKQMMQLSGKK